MVDEVGVSSEGWVPMRLVSPPPADREEGTDPVPSVRPETNRAGRLILQSRSESITGTKAQILECVRQNPGQVIAAIAQHVGCSHNNAARHLDRLCEMGLLVREKEGRGVRHYCPFEHDAESRLESYMQDSKKRRVVEYMGVHPNREWNVNALATEVGVYHTFLLRLLKRLAKRGLVDLYRPGSRYYTRATDKLVRLIASGEHGWTDLESGK